MACGALSGMLVSPSMLTGSCVTVGVPSTPVPCSQGPQQLCHLHRRFAGKVEDPGLFAFSVWRQKHFSSCFRTAAAGTQDLLNLPLWSLLAVAGLSLKFSVSTSSVFKQNYLLESCVSAGSY